MADPIIKGMLAEEAYGPIYSSQYADSQKSARANEIARRMGMAPDIVEAALPDMVAEDRLRRATAEAERNTAYAKMMRFARLAPVAIDDLELPKVAERTQELVDNSWWIGRQFRGMYRRSEQLFGGYSRLMSSAAHNVGFDWYADKAAESARLSERVRGDTSDLDRRNISWEQVKANPLRAPLFGVEQMARSAPDMVLAAAALPFYIAARSGEIGQERARNDQRDDATLRDIMIASPFAAASGYLERIGATKVGGALKELVVKKLAERGLQIPLGVAAKKIGAAATVEAGTEFVQSGIEYAGANVGTEAGFDSADMVDQMLAGAVGGFFGGSIVTGAGHGVARTIDGARNRLNDRQNIGRVDRIMEAAAQSSTRQANPSDFAEALNQLVGESDAENLYIPADKIQELFQEDRNLADDPFWGPHADQIAEAAALGGDIIIPLSTAATHLAGSNDWNALRESVRTRPGGASLAEIKQKQTPEELEKIAAEIANMLDTQLPQLRGQQITAQFAETLGYEGEQAEAITRLLAKAMVQAHSVETAKRAARGEEARPLDEFAEAYLPQAARMTQAEYDAGRTEPIREAAQEAVDEEGEPRGGDSSLNRAASWVIRNKKTGEVIMETFDRAVVDALNIAKYEAVPIQEYLGSINGREGEAPLNQSVQTDSPEFRRWFGDSKVVDENGEPLVVYHGAPDARFMSEDATFKSAAERFDVATAPGGAFWFAKSRAVAATYADDRRAWDYQAAEPGVIAAYLKLENPLIVDAQGKSWREAQQRGKTSDVIEQAQAEGFDGVIIKNVRDDYSSFEGNRTGKPTDTYVVFDSRQIKGVDNRGTFDPNDPSILRDTFARGNISIQRGDDTLMSGAIIRAFEAANFSTAVHELGHFFLEDLRRRALSPDATDQERADWQTFKDWALNDLDGLLVADDQVVPTEAHEFWARGFERYVFEGNAPSQGLRVLFARMRDFMVALYKSIRSFNAPITPEIREVMDRLLASEEEIAARREEMRLGDEALAELMSAEEQFAYAALGDEARETARETLFERVLSTIRNERQRESWARKREIKADVEAEVDAQPVFVALKLLRSGIPQDDGTASRISLSREWLVENYGEDMIARLPKGVPPIIGDDHAFDAETLAGMAGFDSADAMVKALEAVEARRQSMKTEGDKRSPRQAEIEETTDARYRDEVGDPFDDLEEEAEAALVNERQADRLSMELRALSRKTGQRPTAWQAAVEWARGHVRSRSAKDAISGRSMQLYARNAAKAAQRVEEALVKQDYSEAFTAKQQQVLNLALVQQAKQAKDETDKAVRRLQKIANRATIPSVDQDYLDQAHQLLETVDMKTRPQSQIDKRLAFAAWHSRQVELGVDPLVPPEYRETLAQTNWSRMTIDELLELDRTIGQVIELGRLKQRLLDGKKERDFNEAVAEMQDAGSAQPPRTIGATTDPSRSLPGRVRSVLRGVDAAMIKAEQIARWMDGGDPNGPWHRLIFRPMAEAQGREKDLLRTYVTDINDLIKNLPKSVARSWERVVDTPELIIRNANHLESGMAWRGTKDQVVMMAMNWGNEGNRQRLADGFGWERADIEAVFDRTLTKEDWDFVQSVWNTVDKLWPEIEALERRVNGVAPEKVEAVEVQTPHGVYQGGYFPAFYDPTQSTRAELSEADKLSPQGGWQMVTTRASSTRARVEQVKGRPLLLSMATITRHMGEAIHDITHREAVSQVKRLLSDPRVHSLVSTRLGPEYAKAMGAWLENVARPNSAFSKDSPALVNLGRHLNQGVSLVGLGFRITTSLVQLLGIPVAGSQIGAKYLAQGIAIAAAHPVKTYNEITARSAEMRARWQTLDATIEDMVTDVASGKLKQIGPRGFVKHAFDGIAYMDMLVTTSVWTGAFNKALDQGMSEDDAVQFADSVIRTTQGTGGQKDRSAIQNAHPLVRSLYPFFSYMNALYNMQRDVFRRFRNAETLGDYGEAARRMWWVMVVPVVLEALVFGDGPDAGDDDEVTVGDWAAYFAKRAMLGNVGSIPLIGPLANAIGEGYSYRSSAYQQIGEGLVKGWKSAGKLAAGEEELKGSTIKSVMATVGLVTAKPLGQIGATSQGVYDYATGEAEPEDAGDWYELLTKGRISKEPTAAERLLGEAE